MMRTFTIFLYFSLAIIIFASMGVTIPYFFETFKGEVHSMQALNQNIVTYFIAIFVSASLDYILKLIDKQEPNKKALILAVCIGNVAVFTMTGFILYKNSNGSINEISGWAILGVIISYLMWWITNFKNSAFDLAEIIGGSTDKPLTNGK